jgi:hypothetical protein
MDQFPFVKLDFGPMNNKSEGVDKDALMDIPTDSEHGEDSHNASKELKKSAQSHDLICDEKRLSNSGDEKLSSSLNLNDPSSSNLPIFNANSQGSPTQAKDEALSANLGIQKLKTVTTAHKKASIKFDKLEESAHSFTQLSKNQESLLGRDLEPKSDVKRFKAASGHATGAITSMSTKIRFKTTMPTETIQKAQSAPKESTDMSNCSADVSAMDSSTPVVEKKKRGRPKGSYTSTKRRRRPKIPEEAAMLSSDDEDTKKDKKLVFLSKTVLEKVRERPMVTGTQIANEIFELYKDFV